MTGTSISRFVPLVSGLSMIYNQIATALFGVFLAAFLGAEAYGTVNLARTIFIVALVLSPLGLDLGLQRHLGRRGDEPPSNFAEVLWLRATAFSIASLLSLACFIFVANAGLTGSAHAGFGSVLVVTMLALPFATDLAVLGGAYRGLYRPVPSLFATYVLQPTARIAFVLVLVLFLERVQAAIYGTLASFVLAWAFIALKARADLPRRATSAQATRAAAFEVMSYAPVLGVSTFIFTVARSLDTIMLGYFAAAADVGRYAVVLMVGQLVAIIGASLGQTLGTHVAVAAKTNDQGRIAALLHENMTLASLLCAPFCVAIAIWGSDIDLVLGSSYKIPTSVFVIAATTQWLMTVTHYTSAALSMTGRQKLEFINNVVALVVQSAGCLILVPRLGLLGAALATMLTMLAINLIRQIQIGRMLGSRVIDWRLTLPIVLALAAAMPLALIHGTIGFRAWWLTGLFASAHVLASFAGTFWLLMPKDLKQKIYRKAAVFGVDRGLSRAS